jgi:hypothetical protein
MKKLLLAFATSVLASSAIAAETPEVKLEGAFDFQAAVRNQKRLETDNFLTNNQKNNAFRTRGNVSVNVSNESENGLLYGAVVNLKTTALSSMQGGSYLYAESDFGRLEAGSRMGAQNMMSVSAYSIAAATGDDWTAYANLNPKVYGASGATVGAYNGDYSDYGLVYTGYGEASEQVRNVTYYTPKYNGFQVGVSYSPDATNLGDGDIKKDGKRHTYYTKAGGAGIDVVASVKNLMGAAFTYEHNLSDGVDLKLGAGIEQGKYEAKDNAGAKVKLAEHKLYNVGATLTYGTWSVAASYADAGKSGTHSDYHFGKRKNVLYTGGIAYNDGPFGVSLTYLHNDRLKNKLDSYTLGTDYVLAPGFKPYAEVTSFNFKNKGYDSTQKPLKEVNKKVNGMVYLVGAKVTF